MKKLLPIGYFLLLGVFFVSLLPTSVGAVPCKGADGVLGFPAWFKGLECVDLPSGGQTVDMGGDINKTWVIVMNIVQWLILAGGYVAVFFIIVGGFKFIIARGEPDKINEARTTITNAIIGLIIVLASVAIIRTIQASISGNIV